MAKLFKRSWTINGRNSFVNTSGTPSGGPKSQVFSYQVSVSGGTNPKFKVAIKEGFNATTALDVSAQNLEVKEGSAFARYYQVPTAKATASLDGLFPFSPAPSWSIPTLNSTAEARAVRAFYAKINDISHQFQGGVFLGEIGQTVNLIMNPLKGIARLTSTYLTKQRRLVAKQQRARRKNRQSNAFGRQIAFRGQSIKQQLSGNYLAWVFGVVPLMGDIEDLSKTLARAVSDPPRVRFKAVGQAASTTNTNHGAAFTGAIALSRKTLTVTQSSVKYYGMYKAMDKESGIASQVAKISALSGFDLRSFVPTVWNLIPFSFVADYIVNVGDLLEAAVTDTSVIRWVSRTEVNEVILNFVTEVDSAATKAALPGWTFDALSSSPGGYVATSRTISRRTSTVPIMKPELKIGNNTGKHIANLVGLMVSRLSK
jgi:hypothetical protein